VSESKKVYIEEPTGEEYSYLTLEAESPRGYAFYRLESTATKEAIMSWAAEKFGWGKSCGCARDCCGHWFTSSLDVFDMYLAPEAGNASDYIIRVSFARNY